MNGIKVCCCVQSYNDYSIRVYQSLILIFYKCINIVINVLYIFPIMLALCLLALCLMLSMTHYVYNYAGIIGGSLM